MTSASAIPTTAAAYFGAMVALYDSLIQRAVPHYAEMTERLLAYLPPHAERVLELGCGTGNLSLQLAAKYPNASLTFVDAAPEMIEITSQRLCEHDSHALDRTTFITARFESLDLPRSGLDVITSCISLHHVQDKAALYRVLFDATAAGGTLRFADQLRGSTDSVHQLNWSKWLEFCSAPGHCTESEVQSLLDHAAAHDHYTPLREHFQLLETAGFISCDCVWRNLIWGIITADRERSINPG